MIEHVHALSYICRKWEELGGGLFGLLKIQLNKVVP